MKVCLCGETGRSIEACKCSNCCCHIITKKKKFSFREAQKIQINSKHILSEAYVNIISWQYYIIWQYFSITFIIWLTVLYDWQYYSVLYYHMTGTSYYIIWRHYIIWWYYIMWQYYIIWQYYTIWLTSYDWHYYSIL